MSTVKDFIPSATDSIGSTPDTTYFVKGLNNNTEYFFRVAAKDSTGYLGDYSQQLAAIPKYNGPEWFVSNEGNDNGNGDQLSPLRSESQIPFPLLSVNSSSESHLELLFLSI